MGVMARVSSALRQQVVERARGLCEYCQTAQIIVVTMEVDHVQPVSRGGKTEFDNLCHTCRGCNSFKGDTITSIDPQTGQPANLFHPRTQIWDEHFRWSDDGLRIVGLTPAGRATIEHLRMNRDAVIESRQLWVAAGWHPPHARQFPIE